MDRSTSILLNLVRFGAALLVFLHHCLDSKFYSGPWRVVVARDAVMLFFVISGFVIAFVTQQRERTALEFLSNRFSRLYSVVVPALVITFVLDTMVRLGGGAYYDADVHSFPVLRFALSLAFLNQSWNLTTAAFSNGPFWSLCYEFWYYMIFAAVVFAPPRKCAILLSLTLIIAGPRIILMAPVWGMGLVAFYLSKIMNRSVLSTIAFWTASLTLAAMMLFHQRPFAGVSTSLFADGAWWVTPVGNIFIGGDANFLSDYAIGAVFAVMLATCRSHRLKVQVPEPVQQIIDYLASYTFSLYLYYAPVLLAIAAWTAGMADPHLRLSIIMLGTLLLCWLLGTYTEHKRSLIHVPIKSLLGRLGV